MAGRATLRRMVAVALFNFAIRGVAGANDALPGRRQTDRDVRNDPFQLRQNVALKVNVSRVFRRKVNSDDERLFKPSQCPLVRGGKGIAFVL
jgi:hypothetical protein